MNKVLIPDIPISEYEDTSSSLYKPEVTPFWAKRRNTDIHYSGFLLSRTEKELMDYNIGLGKEFSKIQREVGAWAWTNFKEKASGPNPLLGIIEEIGELSKAILKRDQGIRGTPEKHDRDAIDAIGDIMIYLMNHLNVIELDIAPIASSIHLSRMDLSVEGLTQSSDTRKQLVILISRLMSHMEDSPGNTIGTLMTYLDAMARTYDKNLFEVVTDTWAIVSKRNWVEDSSTGGGHTHWA